jgi:hypothetical protein
MERAKVKMKAGPNKPLIISCLLMSLKYDINMVTL